MPARRLATACALLLLALSLRPAGGQEGPAAEPAAEPPARPDLSGHWLLGAKAGDRPAGRLRGAGPRRGDGPRAGGEREGTGPRGGGLGPPEAELELRREGEAGYLLTDGAGRTWPLPADGRERESTDAEGRRLWLRSDWDLEGRLVVRRVQDGRPTSIDSYALDPADGTLVVTRRLSGEPEGAGRRFVYQRAPGPPARPAPR